MRVDDITIDLNGHKLLLRNPEADDAQMLIDYLIQTSKETRFLAREPEEADISIEAETGFINYQNESENCLMLLGLLDGEYVGNCTLMGRTSMRCEHRASIAIALYQRFTGMGIGTKMLETLCAIAKEQGYEQLELEVVAENQPAIALYKKMGFEIFGTLPHNMKYRDGTYADVCWMMKTL
ncbi:MAG: GNAT family N-acetyltransferase [Ruminococcaceae bacterium]|nr:GNAT family N-acetyltransferase [Oscillospiraceae bacterium]